ncbi:MAG: glycosyltransferase family 1 protein [Gammaproteobacteria bacterium]|nr:glycosyltransferase family 1 protein [Gammaproteobacteria bacterium]
MLSSPPSSKNIVLDVSHLVSSFLIDRQPTGFLRVALAYMEHYGHCAQALYGLKGAESLLSRSQSDRLFTEILGSGSKHAVKSIINSTAKPTFMRRFLKKCYTNKPAGGFVLNICYDGLDHPQYSPVLASLGLHPIFVYHDSIPMTHPEYCVEGAAAKHENRINGILKLARGVILYSEATSNLFEQYANQTQQSPPPTVMAPLASALKHHEPGPRPMSAPYFVVLGTIEPRKNHILLLQIWHDLIMRLGEQSPRLVIIGQRGWKCEQVIDLLERSSVLKNMVIERSDCTDSEVATYLHHAQALLFPSFTEGYGLPVAEALTLKVPTIVSDIPVFREIAREIPDYAHPLDGKRWAELILAYTDSHSVSRQAQLSRMSDFKPPTWAEHFSQVDAFIDGLM